MIFNPNGAGYSESCMDLFVFSASSCSGRYGGTAYNTSFSNCADYYSPNMTSECCTFPYLESGSLTQADEID